MNPETTNPIATLDDLELPPPPNNAPLEWAIAWMQSFAQQTSPAWTDEDIARYRDAFRHAKTPAEAVSRGWRKRLCRARAEFETLVRQHAIAAKSGWAELGAACAIAIPRADETFRIIKAIRTMNQIVDRGDNGPWRPGEFAAVATAFEHFDTYLVRSAARGVLPKDVEDDFLSALLMMVDRSPPGKPSLELTRIASLLELNIPDVKDTTGVMRMFLFFYEIPRLSPQRDFEL